MMKEYVGDLDMMYARKDLALKVFTEPILPLDQFVWGKGTGVDNSSFIDCTAIQNLASLYGLAPKIYDIVLTLFKGSRRYAQVTDFLEGDTCRDALERNDVQNRLRDVLGAYGVEVLAVDPALSNIVGGKMTDFQGYRFKDEHKAFRERVINRTNSDSDWGAERGVAYQSVDELGIAGQRDTMRRLEVLRAGSIDFKGKTVLDIGCSAGSFCRYASRRGASRVVGIDIGNVPQIAAELSIYLGDHNIDYYSYSFGRDRVRDYETITELTGLSQFDIVFFLSVNAQIGYPASYMQKLCKEILFLEGHSADKEETYRPLLEKDFSVVEFTGRMKNSARPAFMCRRQDD